MAWTVVGARGRPGPVERVMEGIKDVEDRNRCTVQIFRADRIFGELHLKVAVEHATRAFSQGRNRSKHLGTEILLYAAAERQINNAIKKLGITPGTDEFLFLCSDCANADELLSMLDFQRDDSVLGGVKDHSIFGIRANDVALVGEDRITDLIIEKMALSELDR